MNSKHRDLVTVTDTALEMLRRSQVVLSAFAGMKKPTNPRPRQPRRPRPSEHLHAFVGLLLAARAHSRAFKEHLRWEFAGLTSPAGITAGMGSFPSGHELLADMARISSRPLSPLLINEKFFSAVAEDFVSGQGSRSIPERLQGQFDEHWAPVQDDSELDDVRAHVRDRDSQDQFLALVWSLVEPLRFLDPIRLDAVVVCEHAGARRRRGIAHDRGPFPRTPLTQDDGTTSRSPFTGEVEWSPSSKPNVLRLLKAIYDLSKVRGPKGQLSLAGIYAEANLKGASQTRARVAALLLGFIDNTWHLTATGRRALRSPP